MNFAIPTILSAFIFALTFYFRKQSIKYVSPTAALVIEVCIELIVVGLFFMLFSPEVKRGIDFRSKGVFFAGIAGACIGVGVLLNYIALRSGFLSKVVAVTSPSQIIFGAMLGALLLREGFTFKQIVGTILGIVSVFMLVL